MAPNLQSSDDPSVETVLRDRAQGYMVGLLAQIRQLAKYSHEVFDSLSKSTISLTERMSDLSERIKKVYGEDVKEVEAAIEANSDKLPLMKVGRDVVCYTLDSSTSYVNMLRRETMPEPILKEYEENCAKNPNFELMDELYKNEKGPTINKYSYPYFFEESYIRIVEKERREKLEEMKRRAKIERRRKKKREAKITNVKKEVAKIRIKKRKGIGAELEDDDDEEPQVIAKKTWRRRRVKNKWPVNPKSAKSKKERRKERERKKKEEKEKQRQKQEERERKKREKAEKKEEKREQKKAAAAKATAEKDVPDAPDDIPLPDDIDDIPLPDDIDDIPLPSEEEKPAAPAAKAAGSHATFAPNPPEPPGPAPNLLGPAAPRAAPGAGAPAPPAPSGPNAGPAPPPPMPSGGLAPELGSSLLSFDKSKLKKRTVEPRKPAADPRSSLLDSIRMGKTLKKVEIDPEKDRKKGRSGPTYLTEILDGIREVVEFSDDDDDSSDSDWDDSESDDDSW